MTRPIPEGTLLALGAAFGIGLALAGVTDREPPPSIPRGSVARVGSTSIGAADLARVAQAAARERSVALEGPFLSEMLERLIDEELLVQRALDLGMPQHDRRVRSTLTSLMIDSVVGDISEHTPGQDELTTFFEAHRELFVRSPQLHVRQAFFPVREADDRAAIRALADAAASALRRGESFSEVRERFAAAEPVPLPDGFLNPNKLREYLGPTVTAAALALEPGAVSEPVRSGIGFHVLQLVAVSAGPTPALASIRSEVVAAYRRRRSDEKLRGYLVELRRMIPVEVRSPQELEQLIARAPQPLRPNP